MLELSFLNNEVESLGGGKKVFKSVCGREIRLMGNPTGQYCFKTLYIYDLYIFFFYMGILTQVLHCG